LLLTRGACESGCKPANAAVKVSGFKLTRGRMPRLSFSLSDLLTKFSSSLFIDSLRQRRQQIHSLLLVTHFNITWTLSHESGLLFVTDSILPTPYQQSLGEERLRGAFARSSEFACSFDQPNELNFAVENGSHRYPCSTRRCSLHLYDRIEL